MVNEGSGNGDMVMEATNEVDDMGEDKMEESVKEDGFFPDILSIVNCRTHTLFCQLLVSE